MSMADTARLIASLELKDKFTPGIGKAIGGVGRLETSLGRIGGIAQKGVGTAIGNIAKIGLVGVGILGAGVKGGLDSLAQLESATTSVDGAIKQMGLTGKLTGKQVATWANEIEASVGAAFDDKDITQAATTLLRFGKVTPQNLKPAMVVMTDLATKTGDVDSAAGLLAKALADPEHAAGKLAKAGVILTQVQKDQITALLKSGDAAGAQALLLGDLETATKGAALASQGPYQQSLSEFADATEDAKRALAVGFLPVIKDVATFLKTKLSEPGVMKAIENLGTEGAGLLKDAFEGAKKIPWSAIGDAFKFMGTGAKAAFDIFSGMPEWVKTAVITGWGVNKLTGGALGSIVGELGKGLIKGVLGMTAGMVNVKAASVTVIGGAGVPGVVPGSVPGAPTSTAGKLLGIVSKVFIVGMAAELASEFAPKFDPASTLPLQQLSWPWGPRNTPQLTGTLADILGPNFLGGDAGMPTTLNTTLRDMDKSLAGWPAALKPPLDTIAAATSGALTSLNGKIEVVGAVDSHDAGVVAALSGLKAAQATLIAKYDQNKNGLVSLRETLAQKLGISVEKLNELRKATGGLDKDLAAKLGISNAKLQEIIGESAKIVGHTGDAKTFAAVAAQHLGITSDRLRTLVHESGGWNSKLAAKLGISNEKLQLIKDEARAEKDAIDKARHVFANKDWSPTINVENPLTPATIAALTQKPIGPSGTVFTAAISAAISAALKNPTTPAPAEKVGTAFTAALGPVVSALDANRNGVVSMKEVMAAKLDMTVGQLTSLKQESGGWNATMAAKLGISNEKLQGIKSEASKTVTTIKNKDWSPTLINKTTINNTFKVSARAIVQETRRYITSSGRLGPAAV